MRGSVRIFRRDLLRLVRVPAAWIVIIGMAFVPALYAWFNIAGFWDPYSHTSHIRVAVANEDEGATKDQIGTVNVGAMLETQLKENDQLGWHFVSADEARAEVERGDSYAAFVIPASFSRDLTGIVDGTYVKPNIQYYVNEKNNAVAPKITGAGATSLDRQINSAFVSTVAKVLSEKASEAGVSIANNADQKRSDVSASVSEASAKLGSASQTLDGMGAKIDAAKASVASARSTLSDLDAAASELSTSLDQADQLVSDSRTSLASFSSQMGGALDGLSSNAASALAGVSANAGTLDGAVQGASGRVGGLLTEGTSINNSVGDVLAELNALGIGNLPAAGTALTDLTNQNAALSTALGDLTTLNSDLSATSTSISDALTKASDASAAVSSAVTNARSGVSSQLPAISSALDDFSSASSSMRGSLDTLRSQRDQVSGLLDQLDSLLDGAKTATQTSATNVAAIKTDLDSVATDISSLSSSNTLRDLADSLGVNAESIASFMASPTKIETKAVYPVAAYGSAMAPLFTNLALWIGAFSLVLLFKLDVDEEGIGPISSASKYMGRWMLLAFFGVIQALVVSTGVLVIGVQTVSRLGFVGTSMVISMVFVSIVYMLSTCFQHIGKGLCVIIMVMQIPGSAGLYPIEMLPSFFRFLHPLFPFTYGVNALREIVGGFYGHTYLSCLAVLGAEALVAFAIGLALRPFLVNLNAMITRDLSSSGLFLSEATRVPSNRYRLTQIVAALADHDGFQRSVSRRAARFERRYPMIRRVAIVLGIIVPVALAVLSVANITEVPIVLGAWIVWVLLVISFLIGLQYLREALARQQLLGAMEEEDVRSLLTRRVQGARSRIALGAAAVGASISSALASSRGERGGEDTDEADPGLGDEDPEGDASEAGKGEQQ
ncbi:MAG: YhgE/Pip domain-containing protein [Actinomyces sp.]|nr:YhgE/Pip domain-containing protein [Actinomyces sp.]